MYSYSSVSVYIVTSSQSSIEEVSSVTYDDLQVLRLKFCSHLHLLMAFFVHHLLRICTLVPLPSLAQLWSSTLHTYTCRSAALEKLEVAERCSPLSRSSGAQLCIHTHVGAPL